MNTLCSILQLCLDEQGGTRIYKNIRLYFYSWRWYLCGAEKQSQRVRTHEGVVGRAVNNWLYPKFGNLYSLQLPRDQQQFLFFIGYGYAHVSLCFPLVTVHVHVLLVPYWLLAQAHFYGWMYPPPFAEFNYVHRSRWYSDNHLDDIVFGWMKLSTTSAVFNTCRTWWHSGNHFVDIIFGQIKLSTTFADTTTPAEHGDIPVITLIL